LLNRVISAIVFVLLSTSTLAFYIQPVKASGTIYIRADGSIDPPTAPIFTADNVSYILTDNIASDEDGIVIERDNIMLNGRGHIVIGSGSGNGTTLNGRSNVTVRSVTIMSFYNGIYLYSSSNATLCGNDVRANNWIGICLHSSSGNALSNNSVTANNIQGGVFLSSSSNNTLSGNNVTDNYDGIFLYTSFGNVLSSNDVANNYMGIYLGSSSRNTLSGNRVTDNDESIRMDGSSDNILSNNTATANKGYGIALMNLSLNNTLSNNNVEANEHYGVWLHYSSNNTLSDNNVMANNDAGIYLVSSSNNSISGNNIINNGYGVWFESYLPFYSNGNYIYHNNFMNNIVQVYSGNSVNVWDDDYPSGGNFWSDYNGTDANLDGIGGTPYVIDANNTDHYPLMTSYIIPEFPSFLILPLIFTATLLAVIVYRKKHFYSAER
jgi:parallel beta-helix repeat protein